MINRFLIALIFLIGCNRTIEHRQEPDELWKMVQGVQIIEHQKTGLCFAVGYVQVVNNEGKAYSGGPIMTLIPSHYCGDRDLPTEADIDAGIN